jgi:predicted dehydrogenase/nucleoside-diphosphate-sugar epimerase
MTNNEKEAPARLTVGLIGCGKMGINHIRAIEATGLADIIAVADPRADQDNIRSVTSGDVSFFDSTEALFESRVPDVVHIITPPHTHADLAILALKRGSNVYVEKPFTLTTADAARVMETAREQNRTVCAGHQYLFERPAQIAGRHLDELGRIVHVESYFAFRQVRRNITPAEQVMDILPHAVYPLVAFLRQGQPENVEPLTVTALDVQADGEAYLILRQGNATGLVLVTLNGRPVEQYVRISGTNGTIVADFISGSAVRLPGPGTNAVSVLLAPSRRSMQTFFGANAGFLRRILNSKVSYPGLMVLVQEFYESLLSSAPPPLTHSSVLETVRICEQVGGALDAAEERSESAARSALARKEQSLASAEPRRGGVLVTGGTGLLGRAVAQELRGKGWPVRVLSRRQPRWVERLPGVEYAGCDLGDDIPQELLNGMGAVVHCAAETMGGKDDHQRNSIDATVNMIKAAAAAGVKRFIHISSIAVLKPCRVVGGPVDESSPVEEDPLGRGPYVWGKAESEKLAGPLAAELGVELRIIRPGPLVNFRDFHPPGRLGRELGPVMVAVGPRKGALPVCDVGTAAEVIRSYLEDFSAAPPMLNLVESDAPTRGQLAARHLENRPDLRLVWLPAIMLRLMSPPMKLMQRIVFRGKKPIDVYAAFASEKYRIDLAAEVIAKAR